MVICYFPFPFILATCHPALAMGDNGRHSLLGARKKSVQLRLWRERKIQIGKIRGVAQIRKVYGRKLWGGDEEISVLLTLQVLTIGVTRGFPLAWQLSVHKWFPGYRWPVWRARHEPKQEHSRKEGSKHKGGLWKGNWNVLFKCQENGFVLGRLKALRSVEKREFCCCWFFFNVLKAEMLQRCKHSVSPGVLWLEI